MTNCPKCGSPVPEGAKFCPECCCDLTNQDTAPQTDPGAQQPASQQPYNNNSQQPYGNPQQPIYNAQPAQQQYAPYQAQPNYNPTGSFQTNPTVLLVWSIINLICCCLPLGIVGLVFTLTAKNETTPEGYEKKLKNAFICNLIGTIAGIVFGILSFFMGLFSAI